MVRSFSRRLPSPRRAPSGHQKGAWANQASAPWELAVLRLDRPLESATVLCFASEKADEMRAMSGLTCYIVVAYSQLSHRSVNAWLVFEERVSDFSVKCV